MSFLTGVEEDTSRAEMTEVSFDHRWRKLEILKFKM